MLALAKGERGFTIIELLVVTVITGILMAGIYAAYYSQQKAYIDQEQVSVMRQNLRAGMDFMMRTLQMAGYDPTDPGSGAGVLDMGWDAGENRYISINFTMDITDDADTGNPDGDTGDNDEDITYLLYTDADGTQKLGRKSPSTAPPEPVVENIDALDFVYLKTDGTLAATTSEIRSIQVTVVARGGRGNRGYTNSTTYQNQQGTTVYKAPGDNVRRMLLTREIKCRNIGI
jgi:prepilin-type N-terminal cleavage/methylation domain-containing protein